MAVLAGLVGVVGVAFTIFACVRLIVALRRGAPRELVTGWMAMMVIGAVIVLALLRVM